MLVVQDQLKWTAVLGQEATATHARQQGDAQISTKAAGAESGQHPGYDAPPSTDPGAIHDDPPALIDTLAQAWRTRRQLDAANWQLADEAAAYAVQDGLVAALGWHAEAGRPQYWKSGGGSRQARLTHAPLAPAGVRGHAADFAGFADLALHRPGIEAEIALRVGQAVTAEQLAGLTLDSAASVVDAMAVSVELVASRWQQAGEAPALLRLADCQSHGALALGEWRPFEAARDWSQQACTLTVNDGDPLLGLGCHPLGHPAWGLLPWLQHATRGGRVLPAGSVVTTGAWLVVPGLQAGDRATVSFEGLGAVSVAL